MAQTAQQRIISGGPIVPGDITAHTVNVSTAQSGGLPDITIHYLKCGKYYSNIWVAQNPDTGVYTQFLDTPTTRTQVENILMTVLGLTVDTWYPLQVYDIYGYDYSGSWTLHSPAAGAQQCLTAFIST